MSGRLVSKGRCLATNEYSPLSDRPHSLSESRVVLEAHVALILPPAQQQILEMLKKTRRLGNRRELRSVLRDRRAPP